MTPETAIAFGLGIAIGFILGFGVCALLASNADRPPTDYGDE